MLDTIQQFNRLGNTLVSCWSVMRMLDNSGANVIDNKNFQKDIQINL